MKVDRSQFKSIVGNLLKQAPTARKDERVGKYKDGRPIPPRTVSGQDQQREPDKKAEKSEPSC